MADNKLYVLASDVAISEQKSNDIFLLVEMRILSTQPNGNAEGVTPQFIDEIVANPEKYDCLPLYADVERLLARDFEHLGHMFNAETGAFGTKQIGSIRLFRKEDDAYGTSLIAEGRIPKREAEVCNALMDLYKGGQLNFSFEIRYVKDATVEKDGVLYVEENRENALTGVAVVSVPAYKESVALNLVAEKTEESKTEAEGVENKMTLEEAMAKLDEKDQQIEELTKRLDEAEKKMKELADKKPEPVIEKEQHMKKPEAEDEKKPEVEGNDKKTEEADEALAAKDAEIEALKASCEELKAAKEELDALKAEKEAAELTQNQEKAKTFAKKQGLNVEDEKVAKAIADLDYKAICDLCMEALPPEEIPGGVAVASLMTDGFAMKGGKYDDLLAVTD